MLGAIKNFFVGSEQDQNYEAEMHELFMKELAEHQAKEELKMMQFIIAMSNSLFPGDNSAIPRVEKALEDAIDAINY